MQSRGPLAGPSPAVRGRPQPWPTAPDRVGSGSSRAAASHVGAWPAARCSSTRSLARSVSTRGCSASRAHSSKPRTRAQESTRCGFLRPNEPRQGAPQPNRPPAHLELPRAAGREVHALHGSLVVSRRAFAAATGVGAIRSPVVAAQERTTASVDGARGPKRPTTGRRQVPRLTRSSSPERRGRDCRRRQAPAVKLRSGARDRARQGRAGWSFAECGCFLGLRAGRDRRALLAAGGRERPSSLRPHGRHRVPDPRGRGDDQRRWRHGGLGERRERRRHRPIASGIVRGAPHDRDTQAGCLVSMWRTRGARPRHRRGAGA